MGRVFKPTYTVKGPSGERIKMQSESWHIEWTDSTGRTRHRKAGKKEGDARDALRKAESEVLREKNGLPTRRATEISCAELVKTYLEAIRSQVTARHCQITEQRLTDALAGTRAYCIKDLTPEAVTVFLNELETTKYAVGKSYAPKTINAYLVSLKAMFNWAVENRLLEYNPLDCLSKRPEKVKARSRRALSEDEISQLLAVALEGPLRRATRSYQNRPRKDGTYKPADIPLKSQAALADEGRNIVLAYRLMIEAGLRVNEARCLKWNDLDLENGTMHLRAETTKSGKAESLPITPGLLDALKARKERHTKSEFSAVVKITSRLLRAFDDDLVAAGIATRDENGKVLKRDASGRTVDLHALRHTFGTRLGATPGVDAKSVQTLMRHSNPTLTFGVYVHSDKKRLRSAVDSLPEVKPAALKNADAAALKTGTDNRDETPDDDPKGGVLPTRNQQERREKNGDVSTIDTPEKVCVNEAQSTGIVWQSEGQGFDPPILHHPSAQAKDVARQCEGGPGIPSFPLRLGKPLNAFLLRTFSNHQANHFYVGSTGDLKARLHKHNAGEIPHTSKFRPWRIKTAIAFSDRERALKFEKYLKSGSGRATSKGVFKRHTQATRKPSLARSR